jgi:hypothetical protein NreA
MSEPDAQASHPAIVTRLKRAEGHLRRGITMIEKGRPRLDQATQLQAVERAVTEAKPALIHDHVDHCVTGNGDRDRGLVAIKVRTKLL